MTQTEQLPGSFQATGKFSDDTHFPYGFHRSGDFTRAQADLLLQHGQAYLALASQQREPINEEEADFVRSCRGEKAPASIHERAWNRYLTVIGKPRRFFALADQPPAAAQASYAEDTDADADDD
ncbi:DUF413 domain-containing protein [Marinobacterium arenosum]|uniref:DUF413 domain-containing protein n=1 Tax=Marinobacterium arenosum TaxID=2862496 RepID=UPI001C94010A|nr:DUF413 domain-containing protein [Marinobacterium arenosum]MBY4677758.1 DUF413 domain-containing protein [Marinobacterium arenosum]